MSPDLEDYLNVGVSSPKAPKGGEENSVARPELAGQRQQSLACTSALASCLYSIVFNQALCLPYLAAYRLGAPNALGRSTPHATTSVYQKNEAIEPQQMVIILQYLRVVLITILRRVSAIQNIFWASGLIVSWSFAMGQL
jgi:hypothetical protein